MKCCPCEHCKATKAKATKRWKARTLRGVPIWGDIDAVRAHVGALRERGMGLKTVARLADVSTTAVTHLFYEFAHKGPTRKVTAEVARRLLAVRFDYRVLPPAAIVDSTGARRRLQALVVAGWAVPALAEHAGMSRQWLRRYLFKPRYSAGRCVEIVDLFERLWPLGPPALSAESARRARVTAQRHGWVGIGAWDDETIDDPAAEPNLHGDASSVDEVLVTRVITGRALFKALNEGERMELAHRWRERGGTLSSFATLINRSGEVARRYFEQTDEQRKSA